MKKELLNIIIFISIFIGLISLSSAQLVITCDSYNINITAYDNYLKNCSFTNNHNFDIYNVNLYNNSIITMNDISKINANSTTYSNIKFYSTEQNTYNLTPKFYFYYYVNTTLTPENKNVDIYNFEFRPNILEVTQGSLVTFYNKDNYNVHSVVDQGGEFSSGDILINQSWSRTFNTIKNYTIRDGWVYGSFMYLRVKSNNELILTHNNDYDIIKEFIVISKYNQSNINPILLTPTFVSEWNGTQEGVLSITNNGSYIAKNIKLSGEWVSFSKNNFDLNVGQTTYINIQIIPYIVTSEETNKTYNKTINISSDNTPKYEINYSIFINYSSNVIRTENTTDWVKYYYYKSVFCEKNPNAPDCHMTPLIEYVPTYNCSDMQFNTTMTVAEWQRWVSSNADLRLSYESLVQSLKESNDMLNNSLFSLDNKTQESLLIQKENNKLNKDNSLMELAIVVLFISLLVCGYLLYTGNKKLKMRQMDNIYNIKNERYYK